jgi:hypothetical protein
MNSISSVNSYAFSFNNSFALNNDPYLQIYYKFNVGDSNGTSLFNYASNSYDATLNGGATISSSNAKVGTGALQLTASNLQYVEVNTFTTGTNGMSFSFWFKSNNSGAWARIFDFGDGPSSNNIDFTVNSNGTNKPGFEVYNSGAYGQTVDTNDNNNVWYHYVWTMTYSAYDSLNSTWKIYTNGNFTSTYNNNYYPKNISRTKQYIGKSNWPDAYFNGYIDEFRMYNRVLTATEAAALYNYTG